MFFMQIFGELDYVSSPLCWISIVVSSFDSNMCKGYKNAFSDYMPIDQYYNFLQVLGFVTAHGKS